MSEGYDPAVSGPWSDTDERPGEGPPSETPWDQPVMTGGRPRTGPDFERALEQTLGDRIRADASFAGRVWGSLANVEWQHEKATYGASFRGAGGLLARMRGNYAEYSYMEFYCAVPAGVVDPEVAAALEPRGWRAETDQEAWRPLGWRPTNA